MKTVLASDTYDTDLATEVASHEARRWRRSLRERDGRRTNAPRKGEIVLAGDR